MSGDNAGRFSLDKYADPSQAPPVFRLIGKPDFSPIDLNLAFLAKTGWLQSVDRLRFHYDRSGGDQPAHPVAQMLGSVPPHLLVRRLDREEDRFATVRLFVTGDIELLSNDETYAHEFLASLTLECPPSFHTADEMKTQGEWLNDEATKGMFAGLLAGALGWDPAHGIPENIRDSLEEAKRSLDIANYRSCVVMSRRTLEGVLKFGYPRLLKRPAVDKHGRSLSLDAMIKDFRNAPGTPIPAHLLHVADSIRLVGNVPGAHAADIKDYRFSRSDAEFALTATCHFLDLYFSKIDPDVTQYYTLTVDLAQNANEGEGDPS
jgi:Domain of unknown function (DUF4145)